MIYPIVLILLALWVLGLVTSTLMGGLIHILLVIAIAAVIFRLVTGRRA